MRPEPQWDYWSLLVSWRTLVFVLVLAGLYFYLIRDARRRKEAAGKAPAGDRDEKRLTGV